MPESRRQSRNLKRLEISKKSENTVNPLPSTFHQTTMDLKLNMLHQKREKCSHMFLCVQMETAAEEKAKPYS